MELTREEEAALAGEHGEVQQTAHRILVATGEATGAQRLAPIQWAHLSGVNYNTIGDAGERFLSELSAKKGARVKVMTTLNPMGFDERSDHGLPDSFVQKQLSIRDSYSAMGVTLSFSCIPYELFDLPERGTQVAFAESNAAIHANSLDGLSTNKESSFSALASALAGKSPALAAPPEPDVEIRMGIGGPDELDLGLLGFFAGRHGRSCAAISGMAEPDRRGCKAMCGGMGTSGTCSRFEFGQAPPGAEKIDFGRAEAQAVRDEIGTADRGDVVVLGSPQLGLDELAQLAGMLKGRSFAKDCMVFCPRTALDRARQLGHAAELERAGARLMADCCACLTPLVDPGKIDAVTTNSVKGGYYLKNSTGVQVNLKPLADIVREETR